jgi:hypothetical protein
VQNTQGLDRSPHPLRQRFHPLEHGRISPSHHYRQAVMAIKDADMETEVIAINTELCYAGALTVNMSPQIE